MIHQLYVELTGPTGQVARFSALLAKARSGDRVNLTLMAVLADVTDRVHPSADDVVAVTGKRCVGPLRKRSSNRKVTAYYLDAADDCADEFRSLTNALLGLRVRVTAISRHDDAVLSATHVYWSGKRRLLQYDKRSGRRPLPDTAASSPLPREVAKLLQTLGRHRSNMVV